MPMVLGLALLAFWLYCLFDVITTPDEETRNLPKFLWVIIVVLLLDIGGLLWLVLGRPRPQAAHTPAGGAGDATRPPAPRGPDDDPDFLKDLDRRLRDDD
ncbi:PLD nuclease N-terminal domain-containing protein [Spongiactinospora sp. TRM90649]|uniref:PLD nuclease N-terminal domain-containing protein n=1 Tax=Spongiactinospora sp. TRM90649 TaxID=3031114 RepID=UPI0023F74486|nr:PLD nuclease N-terminal domain-containing protein [Spongiactinospora sp. TRM90649]MDF5754955.1 PLD nuclease N-terminal domain-containing protein [Spongiactinospora sp. TRM90649]